MIMIMTTITITIKITITITIMIMIEIIFHAITLNFNNSIELVVFLTFHVFSLSDLTTFAERLAS